ncbi:hypothetical protein SNEBB_002069 [Seison nebaliae]|nr:hypothetical protein SNEBB_002069 [Seison nebaliae]
MLSAISIIVAIPPFCDENTVGGISKLDGTSFLRMKKNKITSQSELIGRYSIDDLEKDYNSVSFEDSVNPKIKDNDIGFDSLTSLREILESQSKKDLIVENDEEVFNSEIETKRNGIPIIDDNYFTDLNVHKDVSPKRFRSSKSSTTFHPIYRTFQVAKKKPTYQISSDSDKFVSTAKLNIDRNPHKNIPKNNFKKNENNSKESYRLNDKVHFERIMIPYNAQNKDKEHLKINNEYLDDHSQKSQKRTIYFLKQPKESDKYNKPHLNNTMNQFQSISNSQIDKENKNSQNTKRMMEMI